MHVMSSHGTWRSAGKRAPGEYPRGGVETRWTSRLQSSGREAGWAVSVRHATTSSSLRLLLPVVPMPSSRRPSCRDHSGCTELGCGPGVGKKHTHVERRAWVGKRPPSSRGCLARAHRRQPAATRALSREGAGPRGGNGALVTVRGRYMGRMCVACHVMQHTSARVLGQPSQCF